MLSRLQFIRSEVDTYFGIVWSKDKRLLYIFILPNFGFVIDFNHYYKVYHPVLPELICYCDERGKDGVMHSSSNCRYFRISKKEYTKQVRTQYEL